MPVFQTDNTESAKVRERIALPLYPRININTYSEILLSF